MTLRINIQDVDFEKQFKSFLNSKRENAADVNAVVVEILENVRKKGDEALLEYTNKFDRTNLTAQSMRVSTDEIKQAVSECAPETLEALYQAAERIEIFHLLF